MLTKSLVKILQHIAVGVPKLNFRGTTVNDWLQVLPKFMDTDRNQGQLREVLIKVAEMKFEGLGPDYREVCAKYAHAAFQKPAPAKALMSAQSAALYSR